MTHVSEMQISLGVLCVSLLNLATLDGRDRRRRHSGGRVGKVVSDRRGQQMEGRERADSDIQVSKEVEAPVAEEGQSPQEEEMVRERAGGHGFERVR